MLMKIVIHLLPKWIEQKLHPFPASNFGSGHKVAVPCDEDNGIHLLFESKGGNIGSDPHVYSLLPEGQSHIGRGQIAPYIGKLSKPGRVVWIELRGGLASGGLSNRVVKIRIHSRVPSNFLVT